MKILLLKSAVSNSSGRKIPKLICQWQNLLTAYSLTMHGDKDFGSNLVATLHLFMLLKINSFQVL